MNPSYKYLFLLTGFCTAHCTSAQADTLQYLFLGHTYEWQTPITKVDYRVEAIVDKYDYDQYWLGGDNCSETAREYKTLVYLDSLFDLGNPKNHWTLGNHDHRNGNMEWIQSITKRNDYYAHYQDGITVVIWNTNLNASDCENLNAQFDMVMNVCDTIAESSHLILLYHHNIWSHIEGLNPEVLGCHGESTYYVTNCDSINALFYNTVYPRLIEVQQRGIQVINILGDAGWGDPKDYKTQEDIWFVASGINATFYKDNPAAFEAAADEVLIIKHIPSERKLWWEYVSLDDLYED